MGKKPAYSRKQDERIALLCVVWTILFATFRQTFSYLEGICSYWAGKHYFFKCNNRNTRNKLWILFKVNSNITKTNSMTSFLCLYCYLWTYFVPFSNVPMVDFEQVNFCHNHTLRIRVVLQFIRLSSNYLSTANWNTIVISKHV